MKNEPGRQTLATLLALLLLLAGAVAAYGQAAPTPPPEEGRAGAAAEPREGEERLVFMRDEGRGAEAEAPSAAGTLARTLGALLVVVGLVVAAGWGLRRLGGARFGAAGEGATELRVLNSIGLGDRRSLAVVRFGGRELLIGSTAQTITLLCAAGGGAEGVTTPAPRSVAELLDCDGGGAGAFEAELSLASNGAAGRVPVWEAERGES